MYENIVNQRICRHIFTSIPQILLFHGCLLGKGFSLSFVVSYFSITWPMNDSGATVFVANSHSFFITAVSWKTSSVLDHPARAWLHFHHWWMKCNAGILLLCMLRFPDARCLLFFFFNGTSIHCSQPSPLWRRRYSKFHTQTYAAHT